MGRRTSGHDPDRRDALRRGTLRRGTFGPGTFGIFGYGTFGRGSVAVAAVSVLVSGLSPMAAPAAVADTPSETVVPAAMDPNSAMDNLLFTGPGGFLHQRQSGYVWTRYSGGPDIPVSGSHTAAVGNSGAGSDIVATYARYSVQLQDMDSGTTSTIALPSGQRYIGTFGSRVLTYTLHTGAPSTFDVLSAQNGQVVDVPVTGLPDGTSLSVLRAADADSVVVTYGANDQLQLGLLDLASGQVRSLDSGVVGLGVLAVLTGTRIAWYDPNAVTPALHLLDRADLSAPQTTVTVPKPALPSGYTATVGRIGIAGDSLLVGYTVTHSGPSTTDDTLGYPLYAMPLTGGDLSTVLDHARGAIETDAGGAMTVGGPSAADWAARRLTQAPGGTLTATAMDDDAMTPLSVDGLSLAGGQLLTVEGTTHVSVRHVVLGTPPAYDDATGFGTNVLSDCSAAATCAPPMGTGNGLLSQLKTDSTGDSVTVQGPSGAAVLSVGHGGGSLVDSDGRHVVYGNATTGNLIVGELAQNGSWSVRYSGAYTAAALSGRALWTAAATPGVLDSRDLSTLQPAQTVDTGAPCVPAELQTSAGRWIYWSCGASGPAGVYDLTTKQDVPVPAGRAQLGDGFVVTHDTARGKLVLTDVHTGTALTSDLADLPAPAGPVTDDRRVTWAVDRYSGGIAYLDAQRNIHLVDPHIPHSPASGYRMLPGQRLDPGDSLTSAAMRLVMQPDGNLVAYLRVGGSAAPAEWASGTWGHPGAYALMRDDGSLAVYGAGTGPGNGSPLWSSWGSASPHAYATLQDDGNLVVYRESTGDPRDALWSTGSYALSPTIASGYGVTSGWWTQGRYTFLVMQKDGNLVMYRKRDGKAVWSSGTSGHPGAYAVMQPDGNFVVYRKGSGANPDVALWSSGTWGHPGAYAIMQDDGNFVVYRKGGSSSAGGALWSSGTWRTSH